MSNTNNWEERAKEFNKYYSEDIDDAIMEVLSDYKTALKKKIEEEIEAINNTLTCYSYDGDIAYLSGLKIALKLLDQVQPENKEV